MSILDLELTGARYAVIDLETTGFSPGRDRVLEIAVYHYQHGREPELVMSTLVNPQRPVAGTDIHGITDADVRHAPTFATIGPALLEAIEGRVIASHNASFDRRFLAMELERIGRASEFPYVCTMYLRPLLGLGQRASLADCCRAHDLPAAPTHDASVDAELAARLLGRFLAHGVAVGLRTFADLAARKSYKFVESFALAPLGGAPASAVAPARTMALPSPAVAASAVAATSPAPPAPSRRPERSGASPGLRDYLERLWVAAADFELSAEEAEELRHISEDGRIGVRELRQAHTQAYQVLSEQAPSREAVDRFFAALGVAWSFDTSEVGPALANRDDLLTLAAAERPVDWLEDQLEDVRVWTAARPSTDTQVGRLARQLDDITAAQRRSDFSLRTEWDDSVTLDLGPRPGRVHVGASPAQLDPRDVARDAVRRLGFWSRVLPWRRSVRAEAIERALAGERERFEREERAWRESYALADQAGRAWDERRASWLDDRTPASPRARRAFMDELLALGWPAPVRCLVAWPGDGEVERLRVELVLPSEEDVPGTLVQTTKAGRPSIVKAPPELRRTRWEEAAKLLAARVAFSALNAFARAPVVELVGYAEATGNAILVLLIERARAAATRGPFDLKGYEKAWSPADATPSDLAPSRRPRGRPPRASAAAPGAATPRVDPVLDKAVAYDRDEASIMAVSKPRLARQALHELMGMATVITHDGRVTDEEIALLRDWLAAHRQHTDTWPVDRIANVLHAIVADGVISDAERAELLEVLRNLSVESDLFGRPPGDVFDAVSVVFDARRFVITGKLRLCRRAELVERLRAVGAEVQQDVVASTDFLVIGIEGSDAWATGRYGTKIEKAMRMKREHASGIAIVREVDLVEALITRERRGR